MSLASVESSPGERLSKPPRAAVKPPTTNELAFELFAAAMNNPTNKAKQFRAFMRLNPPHSVKSKARTGQMMFVGRISQQPCSENIAY
jgi:hypothetical protein